MASLPEFHSRTKADNKQITEQTLFIFTTLIPCLTDKVLKKKKTSLIKKNIVHVEFYSNQAWFVLSTVKALSMNA